ncbi:hypothetical protein BDV93DRAFT_520837 [Ceratobasidium sp. AG-I]|nr:hypothetical protein BDV93DRAFT_520837 [Ceratobasidium sp. AG-I]
MQSRRVTPRDTGLFSAVSCPQTATSGLSDLGRRSSSAVVGYITSLPESDREPVPPHLLPYPDPPSSPQPSPSHPPSAMASTSTASTTNTVISAEERMAVLLSNQYNRRMHRNRAAWYKGSPLDTAPKCFESRRRDDTPLIRDWQTYHKVVAVQTTWAAKAFQLKHYEINGVIWGWSDPSAKVIVELFTSDTIDTIEYAISSDPFRAPHVVVTHSQGDEPHCLDAHGNPDQLGDSPAPSSKPITEIGGFTPRQSSVGPTGKQQLFLPPRLALIHEREFYATELNVAANKRQKVMRRQAFIFQAGLRRIRERREFIRDTGLDPSLLFKDSPKDEATHQTELESEADFEPMTEEEIAYEGLSERTECPLLRLGIFQQEDIAAMADSAVIDVDESEETEVDEEEEADSEPEEEYTLPSSPALSHDTFAVLRRLGMVDSDSDSGSDYDEESDSDSSVPESESASDAETEFQDGDVTIGSWNAAPAAFPTSTGFLNLASVAGADADEDSSVSSLFVGEDQDSFDSDCESPDTEEEEC